MRKPGLEAALGEPLRDAGENSLNERWRVVGAHGCGCLIEASPLSENMQYFVLLPRPDETSGEGAPGELLNVDIAAVLYVPPTYGLWVSCQ